MKISWNWLNEWIDLEGIEADELAERLTMSGLEVEFVERLGAGVDDIVVGKILEIVDHPKADRLVICTVDAGEEAPRQIVCGAKNMKAGDRVPTALPGSQPPALDFEIGEREVMGVPSSGMLCAEEELGFARESEGLMILPGDLPLGRPVFEALGFKDTVFHIGLTPNRADCLSHLGVAREVGALYGRALRAERVRVPTPLWENENKAIGAVASLQIDDEEGCPQYGMAVLEDVEVGPGPLWLRRRLLSVGVRSINNIVDVTNFVLMDVGQPLHTFDLDELAGQKIIVRRARKGETLLGIDHREYALEPEDLVIADAERPVALAGVMGGANSEVTEKTRRILLECAYFDPRTVRRSARRHSLHTESSHRFERGIDPGAVEANMSRAVSGLVRAHEHLESGTPVVDQGVLFARTAVPEPAEVRLPHDMANRILGTEISDEAIQEHLLSLGLEVRAGDDAHWGVLVPTYRLDLERPIDLVEEIARLHGYDQIPTSLPRGTMGYRHGRRDSKEAPTIIDAHTRGLLRWMRTTLLENGLYEAVNYSFMGEEELDALGLGADDCRRKAAPLANPLIKTQGLMRTTLVPSLLQNLATNLAQRTQDVALFEMGRRYFPTGERRTLGIVLSGDKLGHWRGTQSWDFFDLKGIVETLASPFELGDARWVVPEVLEPYLHPGVQAMWLLDGAPVATVGQLHPGQAQEREIEGAVYLAELDVDLLLARPERRMRYKPLPKFPGVHRDFALLYERQAPYSALRQAIDTLAGKEAAVGEILESVELFDLYEGEQIPEGKRSLALSLVYRSTERTLTEDDVEKADRLLLEWLEKETGASLR
ncbi:MAG: phenylalanine--tRNA ligase subunit beta [Bradymonadaceae bacterium]